MARTKHTNPEKTAELLAEIGKRITLGLAEAGMTQTELSGKLGITRSAVANYCAGKHDYSIGRLVDIATAVGKPTAWLTGVMSDEEASVHTRINHIEQQIQACIGLIGSLLPTFLPADTTIEERLTRLSRQAEGLHLLLQKLMS